MTVKFQDVLVSREHMFSVGFEQDSGRFYVSIPVSNGMVDYEEYYEVDRATFDLFLSVTRMLRCGLLCVAGSVNWTNC